MTVFNCNGECESCRLSRRYREDGDDYYTCDSKNGSTTESTTSTSQTKKKSELDLFDNEIALADDNKSKTKTKSDNKIDTSNYSKLAKSVKNVIIVGDQKAADTIVA